MDILFSKNFSYRAWFYGIGLICLILLPLYASATGQYNLISFGSLIMCFAMAAVSLNLIMGFGGMVSFGHAAYLAVGGYTVGISVHYGYTNGFLHLLLAALFAAVFALITGAISLKTKGVYFIMITLAFAQMMYFAFISLEEFGGDDGLIVDSRSDFSPFLNIENDNILYYLILTVLIGMVYLVYKIVNSRFGAVIQGTMSNEPRMQALGYATYQYRIVCYVIAGVMCAMAGVLYVNYANFVNPGDTSWTTSGELIFMVVLGGMGSVFGPVLGAATFFIIAEYVGDLPEVGVYWRIYFGPFLILVVLFARSGIDGWLGRFIVPPEAIRHDMVMASGKKRMLATAIDVAILVFLSWLLIMQIAPALMELPSQSHHSHLIMIVCSYFVMGWVFYNHFILPSTERQGSVGKILTGLRVVSADGRTMTATQAVQRNFGQLLNLGTLLVGYIGCLMDPKRLALHDDLAATRVIERGNDND
ncbi:MAG: RDD family protein [Rhizobiales bacterium]|nr:RDD family protein [Hyphomicrobiales bacterium]